MAESSSTKENQTLEYKHYNGINAYGKNAYP